MTEIYKLGANSKVASVPCKKGEKKDSKVQRAICCCIKPIALLTCFGLF